MRSPRSVNKCCRIKFSENGEKVIFEEKIDENFPGLVADISFEIKETF